MSTNQMRVRRGSRRRLGTWVSHISATAILRDLPGWMFLAALIHAPWAYGGTTADSIKVLDLLLGSTIIVWLIDLVLSRRAPGIPIPLALIGGVILLLGWLMALNAGAIYDEHFEMFLSLPKPLTWAPGSIDRSISIAWMTQATVLILSVCFVADVCCDKRWLLRIWVTVGMVAGSIALFGLLQKASNARMIFWAATDQPTYAISPFFATYYYHANAGAFLNLVLPLTVGLALRVLRRSRAPVQEAIWFATTLLVVIAMAVNTSRMGQLLGLGVIVALAVGPARRPLLRAINTNRVITLFGLAVSALLIFVIAYASRIDKPIERWRNQTEDLIQNERWLASRIALEALPDAGLFGFGPATFRAAFPHYLDATKIHSRGGIWTYLHEDYLQTILEWGWLGSAAWALLFFGGIGLGVRTLRALLKQNVQNRWSLLLPLLLIALGSTAVHALVDFPFQIYSIQLYVATYLGICWGSGRANFDIPDSRQKVRRHSPSRGSLLSQAG